MREIMTYFIPVEYYTL